MGFKLDAGKLKKQVGTLAERVGKDMENIDRDKIKKQWNSFVKVTGKAVQTIQSASKTVSHTVMDSLTKSESVNGVDVDPFFVRIFRGEVSILEKQESWESCFGKDYRGTYFYTEDETVRAIMNQKPTAVKKKYYFQNGDWICLPPTQPGVPGRYYLYSLMNQKHTVWNSYEISQNLSEAVSCEALIGYDTGQLVLSNPQGKELFLNNRPFWGTAALKSFDCVMIEDRCFVSLAGRLYAQEPLKEEEHLTLASRVNQIGKEDNLSIDIHERTVKTQNGEEKCLLKGIQMEIHPGEMVLVLGGSGAGKTTFFNAVMGVEKADATIHIGPHNLYEEFNEVRRMLAFVPQFDCLRPSDTVAMTLQNAAQMKLPAEIARDERLREKMVAQVLEKLNLTKQKETLVSKLSGGQRKRLSVATEYISDPAIFFLDEPDSGLDGSQAITLMDNLRTIADDGKIVLVISHSPDRTRYDYDKVIVLAKDSRECGQLAYYGAIDCAMEFFGVENLESIVKVIDERPEEFIQKYQEFVRVKADNTGETENMQDTGDAEEGKAERV